MDRIIIYSLFIISLLPILFYTFLKVRKSVHMFQQNSYNYGRFNRYMMKNINNVFPYSELIILVLSLVGIYYLRHDLYIYQVGIYFVAGLVIILFNREKGKAKKPLKYTARIKRLFFVIGILFVSCYGMFVFRCVLNSETYYNIIAAFSLITVFTYLVTYIASLIVWPVEKLIKLWYLRDAARKIRKLKNIDVIGITGSYGKTSSKLILNTILSSKFYTLASPKSFNTPMGLTITIRNYLRPIHEYFIAEMGAYKIGEIKELCNLTRPKYGIITSIGQAHLETFGSQENIQKGKMELVELLPSDGLAILNLDDKLMVSYEMKNNVPVKWYAVDNHSADYYAYDIEYDSKGTTFKVKKKGDANEYVYQTCLLGKHNVYNILAAITLANHLGIEMNSLRTPIQRIEPVEHRLELKKQGNVTIIDDAFNSNPVGSKMALEVLSLMAGKKIIITPGMIELGKKQYDLNREFGKQIAEVCDFVILVGEKQTIPIQDGLDKMGFDYNNLEIVNSIDEAFVVMRKQVVNNTFVLLENDLPDIFNER